VAEYDVHEEERNGVKLMYVVPPGTPRETVDRCYAVTGDMLDFFEKTIGIDYPFGKYAQVVVQNFIYGGMENTTATVMNMRTLHDQGLELTESEQGLVAHELAHQWWGDMVTCREWTHMWLNEGFATYYQGLFRQHYNGDDAFRYQMFERHASTVRLDDRDARPVVTDFYNRRDARNNHNVYAKGASVLHMMRHYLGDELFHAVIREYAENRMHDTAETSDLARAVKDVTGENLDWFFEQWLYLAGHPKFHVSKQWDPDKGLLRLSVKQTQETGGTVPVFRAPLDVEITTSEGAELHRIVVESAEQDFYFRLDEKPKMVVFDKGDWVLKTLEFSKLTGELLYQLEHGDYMARVRAAAALGKKGADERTVPALAAVVMADGHYGLRRTAALALGHAGTDEARDALADALATAGDARTRKACAEALGSFRHDEDAASALQKAFSADAAWAVRAAAVTSTVKLDSKDARRLCEKALDEDGGRGIVRRAGLNGLVKLGDPEALGRVRPFAKPGNDREHHRHTAISAYARLARKLEESRDREKAADFLSDMLDDWYLRTRRTVIDGLRTLGEPAAVPALRRAAASDPLESLRRRADRAADHIESGTGKKDRLADVDRRVRELDRRLGTVEAEMDKARGSD
jgi:aminopeptidase N